MIIFEKIIHLDDTEFESVFSSFATEKLKKHQFLIQQGDRISHDYLIVNSCLKAYYTTEDGKEHILQFVTEKGCRLPSLFKMAPATIQVDCLESCKMQHFFRKKSNDGYVALQNRILSLLMNNPSQRYELFVNLYPELVLRISKQQIASYLGVSRETLSRLLNK